MKLKWIGLIITSLVIFSCREKEQVDVKAPTIESLTINGVADNQQSVSASETITIGYTIKDNIGLKSSSFNIHAANNGHAHSGEGSQGGEYRLTSGNWSFEESASASGTSYSNSHEIQVPDSIAGVWHVEVIAKDAVGYSASRVISLNVVNNNLPTISLVSSTPEIGGDGYIHVAAGSTVSIIATAHDSDNLSSVYVRLGDSSGNTLNQQSIPVSGNSVSFGPVSYTGLLSGEYRIIIDAFDFQGYHAVWDVRLKVQ